MNTICERLIATLHRELLDRILILNQAQPEPILERDKTGNLVPGAGRVAGQASEIIWDHAGW
ncbi:MAG: hypothetical protein ACLP5E_02720 [Streptosporangiaceae bacterium]